MIRAKNHEKLSVRKESNKVNNMTVKINKNEFRRTNQEIQQEIKEVLVKKVKHQRLNWLGVILR